MEFQWEIGDMWVFDRLQPVVAGERAVDLIAVSQEDVTARHSFDGRSSERVISCQAVTREMRGFI